MYIVTYHAVICYVFCVVAALALKILTMQQSISSHNVGICEICHVVDPIDRAEGGFDMAI